MANIPKHKLYDDAVALFVEQGMTCDAINEQLGISRVTLSKWRSQMNWEQQREDNLSSPGKIKELLQRELKSVAAGNKSGIDTDALSKISKALQYFTGKVSLPVIISVFKEFDDFMAETDPDTAVKFCEFHKMFIHRRAQLDSLK